MRIEELKQLGKLLRVAFTVDSGDKLWILMDEDERIAFTRVALLAVQAGGHLSQKEMDALPEIEIGYKRKAHTIGEKEAWESLKRMDKIKRVYLIETLNHVMEADEWVSDEENNWIHKAKDQLEVD